MAKSTAKKIGYARVSRDDQDLLLQIDALVKAGVHPDDIYKDVKSGGTADRPGFVDMWKDLRPGDTLVVWKLDRLGRSVLQLSETAEKLKRRDVELFVITQPIDSKTSIGRLMFNILAAMAQFERDVISERTIAGLAARKE